MAYPFCLNCSIFRPRGVRMCPNCGADFAAQDAQLAAEARSARPMQPKKVPPTPNRFSRASRWALVGLLLLILIAFAVQAGLTRNPGREPGAPSSFPAPEVAGPPPLGPIPTPPPPTPPYRPPVPTPTGPIHLAYRFRAGQEALYRVVTSVTGEVTPYGQNTIKVNRTIDQTILMYVFAVDKEGTAVIDLFPRKLLSDNAGRRDASHYPIFRRMRIARNGRVIQDSGLGVIPGPPLDVWLPVGGQLFPLLPSSAVGPDDQWTDEISQQFRFGDGYLRARTTGTHAGFTSAGEPEIKMYYRLPLDVTVYLPRVLPLDGYQDQDSRFARAKVRYAGFAADVGSEAWLDPRGRPWPTYVDLSAEYAGEIWLHDFLGQAEPQEVRVHLQITLSMARLD